MIGINEHLRNLRSKTTGMLESTREEILKRIAKDPLQTVRTLRIVNRVVAASGLLWVGTTFYKHYEDQRTYEEKYAMKIKLTADKCTDVFSKREIMGPVMHTSDGTPFKLQITCPDPFALPTQRQKPHYQNLNP